MSTAEGAIASAVEKLGLLLGQLLIQEANFLRNVRGDVEWLRAELRRMESFLKDADSKRRRGDERVKNWVRDVRDAAYQAEDVVDAFMLQIERGRGEIKEFFRRYACIPSDLINLHGIGNEILQIKAKVHSIRESREAYGIVNLGESSGNPVDERFQTRRQLSPRLHDDAIVVGFDANKKLIVDCLLDPDVERRCTMSIVGMGGLGKTTLAVKVYNSNEVKSHFSSRAWITVSQDFRVIELLRNVAKQVMRVVLKSEDLESMKKMGRDESKHDELKLKLYKDLESLDKLGLDELKLKLYDFLQRERYLIVLDDIWEQVVWEQIKDAFPNAMNGSRLLITTRSMDVAKSSDPRTRPYELPFLSDEESWELFLKVTFPCDQGVTPSCPPELEVLGQKIVKRCGGLPLAVVVLGGLLSVTDPTVTAWREVTEDKEWESKSQGFECLQILALSYNHLPNHNLKSCFLYLGSFPEDYQIKTSDLIRFWIAEGFIPQKENRTLEDTAKGYLDELVQRCMVHVTGRSVTTKKAKSVQIHDLFRDWCISEAKEDGFFNIRKNYINTAEHEFISSRRLVLLGDTSGHWFRSSTYKARTILFFNSTFEDNIFLKNTIRGFKLLRVIYLHLPESRRSSLPKEISNLVHLRNLSLRSSTLRHLPSSIGKLPNLQSLDVRGTNIEKLPRALYRIQTLRHVYTARPLVMHSSGIGSLRSLQTLDYVKAGSWIGTDLANLSSLCKLYIINVSETEVDALSDSLHKLSHLVSLYLGTKSPVSAALLFTTLPSNQQCLCKLTLKGPWAAIRQLPENLIHLKLEGCELDQSAIAALEMLPCLAIVNLVGCTLSEHIVCSAGGFSGLQNLQVDNLINFTDWRIESGAMPRVTFLKFTFRDEPMSLPDGVEHMASVQKLVIAENHITVARGRFFVRDDVRHKIQHIPYVEINGRSFTGSQTEVIVNRIEFVCRPTTREVLRRVA